MAFPNSAWPCVGNVDSNPSSAGKEEFEWFLADFLRKCWKERKKLGPSKVKAQSVSFSFAGATWNFFLSVDQGEFPGQFRIDIQTHRNVEVEFECCCDVFFLMHKGDILKNIEYKFKYENAGSRWTVEDFLSDSELDDFLQYVNEISCVLYMNNSSIKKACSLPGSDSVVFLESTWPCGGSLCRHHISTWVTDVQWFITELHKFWEARKKLERSGETEQMLKLKSIDFSFGDATFYFFFSFDPKKDFMGRKFGIHFQTRSSSNEVYDCCINISSKKFKCRFKCESGDSQWTVKYFSDSEFEEFAKNYHHGINCRISREKCNIKRACSPAKITSSSKSGASEVHAKTQHLENDDQNGNKDEEEDEDPMVKICKDIKNFFSEEHSDSDGTNEVRNHLLKAHRSMRMARKAHRNRKQ